MSVLSTMACYMYRITAQTSKSTKLTNMLLKKPVYNWYAIYTKPNSEKKLYSSLVEKQIECYLPLRKVLRYWSDRKKWIEEPLFKGYLFAKVSYKEFFDILNTPGAVCYVSFGGRAQPIPEKQMSSIKTMVEQAKEEMVLTYKNIMKGQKAEVVYGALKGIQGEIVEIHGQERILIRLESMNCSLHANISKDEVRILDEAEYLPHKKNTFYGKTGILL